MGRMDNDNVDKGRPTFKAARQVFHELQKCSGCTWDTDKGWSLSLSKVSTKAAPNQNAKGKPDDATNARRCPIIGGYVGAFDRGFFCENSTQRQGGQCHFMQLP